MRALLRGVEGNCVTPFFAPFAIFAIFAVKCSLTAEYAKQRRKDREASRQKL
jgi:hypothetical protein